ncbi:MAG: uracil-DNA glycosylase [Bacteroidetes bacterium]|nr:uracil-DNA glycosylase [Bacteroidota bacterium]
MSTIKNTPGVDPKLNKDWKDRLRKEFESSYFVDLKAFLLEEKASGKQLFPPGNKLFNAFDHTSFDSVKVVILGQDPYHGPGQAHGLCFSVAPGIQKPPSLQNIFKEIRDDLGYPIPESGNLESWAKQGVLLLNATLTVRAGEAGSHQNKGWEQFTNAVIRLLSEEKEGLIFLLWGRFAQAKEAIIDTGKHFVLKAAHPSPLSAYNGFFGCKHFSKVNEILLNTGRKPINWKL